MSVNKHCKNHEIIRQKKINVSDQNKIIKYYCDACDYKATSSTNLHIHCQSKKHIKNVSEFDAKTDKFYKEIINLRDDIQSTINKYKKLNIVKSGYSDVEKNLKNLIDVIPTISINNQDSDDYVCNGCKKAYNERTKYKLHIEECLQFRVRHNALKEITIELIIQLKQLQEICNTKISNPSTRTSAKDKKIKDLEEKIKLLDDQNNKLQNVSTNLDSKLKEAKQKIFDLNTKIDTTNNDVNKLNTDIQTMNNIINTLDLKNKILKEKYKNCKSQNNTISMNSHNNIYNNKTNFQIIFNNSPPFEFVNPFNDPITGISRSRKFIEEKEILLEDNHNQSVDIKSKLCNAITFSKAYQRKKLVDFVALSIINMYVKENASEQSIWNTDTTRNTYNIRINDRNTNRNFWQKDKEGVTLKKILIQPILRYLQDVMNTYQHYCTQKHLAGKTEFEYPATNEINDLYFKFMNSDWEDLEDLTIDEIKALSQCSSEDERKIVIEEISKIEQIAQEDEKEVVEEINSSEKIIDLEEINDSEEFDDYNDTYSSSDSEDKASSIANQPLHLFIKEYN